ncbi:MAG: formylglycine-generating enzyme family protein [Thermodesulfobacteriota bacterium]
MAEEETKKRTLVMVRVPAGEFEMGSGPGQGEPDEFPAHKAFLDEFLLGRHLVTAAEFARFLNSIGGPVDKYFEPSKETSLTEVKGRFLPRGGCAEHPANGVSWFGAAGFCDWLTQKTGKTFRLPTEAEWEKAARGGLEGKRYPWGNDSPEGKANYGQNFTNPKYTLTPVGSYPPNPYGLYDMAGNLWEWCQDWYEKDYYRKSPARNPTGPETGTLKVIRGGSWGGLDIQVRCGIRIGENPYVSDSRVGFRLARTP